MIKAPEFSQSAPHPESVAPDTNVEKEHQLTYVRLGSEARQVQKAVEEERCRIARELHDEFGQGLTGLKFDLAWLGRRLAQPLIPARGTELLNKVQAMSRSIDALLGSVRATAEALRPAMLDDLGLSSALECLARTFQDRTGVRCAIDVTPVSSIVLPSELSTALFRIAQELLTNVMRHASASQVQMRLRQDAVRVTLEVTDNGKGISSDRMDAPHSFGLRGMRERAALLGGHFHIVGAPGVGTTATVSIPAKESFDL